MEALDTAAPARRAAIPDYTSPDYWGGLIKMSLSKFFILCVLNEGPRHGYDLAKQVAETTRGCCSPTAGTLYPMLKEFEAGGYVTAESATVGGRPRKTYAITERGREAFRVAVAAWLEVTRCITASGEAAGLCGAACPN